MEEPAGHEVDRVARIGRWVGLALGVPVLLIGLRGVWVHRIDTSPYLGDHQLVRFWLGGALLHDLVIVPIVIALGLAVRALVPPSIRRFVQAGLLVSVGLCLFAYPLLRGFGRRPDNPSLVPRNYAQGLTAALLWTWSIVALLAFATNLVAWRRSRRAP